MRRAARVALALTLALGGILVLPRGGAGSGQAFAQIPIPTLTILPSDDPDPTPTVDPEDPSTGGGGGSGGGGGDTGGSSDGGDGDGGGGSKDGDSKQEDRAKTTGTHKGGGRPGGGVFVGTYRPSGSFNTDRLVARAAHLRSLGIPTAEVIRKVFPPFIIAGHAAWTNTWGAPRYGPAPGQVRTHQGQDVFCDFGAPVLATVPGTVSFGDGGIGGKVARVHTPDGGYWYYAHLSGWNNKDFAPGDRVEVGDVIGFCGNTGNALTTPPHVHFGHYNGAGVAVNPHRDLVDWLREAERRTGVLVDEVTSQRTKAIDSITLSRRFGDAFMPDTAVFSLTGDSLWASGSSPGTGTFSLADIALRTALSDSLFQAELDPVGKDNASREVVLRSTLTPSAILSQLISGGNDDADGESAD